MKINVNKSIKRVVLAATVSVFALGMAQNADAYVDSVATIGHCSASVGSTLNISETNAVRFGDMVVSGTPGAGDASFTLSAAGVRSAISGLNTDGLVLYNGHLHANGSGSTAAGDDAGGEAAGIYHISGASATNIYISFSVAGGGGGDAELLDANHLTNFVLLSNGTDKFCANNFTIGSQAGLTTGSDIYGNFITLTGATGDVNVGATLYTAKTGAAPNTCDNGAAPTYADGKYTGTFNIMASY